MPPQAGNQSQPLFVTVDRVLLKQVLIRHFSEEELRDLTFDMNIDYETLPGTNKVGKVRELIVYTERHSKFSNLIEIVRMLRPHAFEK